LHCSIPHPQQEAEAQGARPTELAAIAATVPHPSVMEPLQKKRRGPKEPNPLSVRKKKPKTDVSSPSASKNTARDHKITDVTHRRGLNAGSESASTGKKRKRIAEGSDDLPAGLPETTIHDQVAEGREGDHDTVSVPPNVLSYQSAGLEEFSGVRRRNRRGRGNAVPEDPASLPRGNDQAL
jgi:hypothetical protein